MTTDDLSADRLADGSSTGRSLTTVLRAPWRGRPFPLYVLLLAAYPVLYVYGENVGEARPADLVGPLAFVVAAAALGLGLAAYAFGDARRAALVVGAVVAALLLYGFAREIVRPVVRVGNFVQQAAWLALGVLALVAALRLGASRLAGLTRLFNIVTALLVVLALVTIVPAELGRAGRTAPLVSSGIAAASDGPGRDIWYLVFDRFGSARSLELMYGIDDRPFLDRLRRRGFVVLDDSRANYVKTTISLASTLNLDFIDDIAAQAGPDSSDHGPLYDRLADHRLGRFLREHGYEYIHVGSYFQPTRGSNIADRNLTPTLPSDFAAALYDESAVPGILRRLGVRTPQRRAGRAFETSRYQIEALEGLLDDPGPNFVFGHVLLPHPPYVFDQDGNYVAPGEATGPAAAQFADQLAFTEAFMEHIVDELLSRPEAERPIIILQGDEGPYPDRYQADTLRFDWSTATTEELEIKFGIFNAMYLPGRAPDAPPPPSSMTSVNTFRFVLSEYFDADLPLLPDDSFTSRAKNRPYDLTRITDRLPPPTATP